MFEHVSVYLLQMCCQWPLANRTNLAKLTNSCFCSVGKVSQFACLKTLSAKLDFERNLF